MTSSIFFNKCILLLGSGELGKEILIESQRLGCKTVAVDKYADAPAMQVADESFVLNMSDKDSLKKSYRLRLCSSAASAAGGFLRAA